MTVYSAVLRDIQRQKETNVELKPSIAEIRKTLIQVQAAAEKALSKLPFELEEKEKVVADREQKVYSAEYIQRQSEELKKAVSQVNVELGMVLNALLDAAAKLQSATEERNANAAQERRVLTKMEKILNAYYPE